MSNFCPDCGKVIKANECLCGWKGKAQAVAKSQHEIFRDHLAERFKRLPASFKHVIREAEAEGIHWRGDDREFFEGLIPRHRRMKAIGIPAYRQEARKAMRKAFTGTGLGKSERIRKGVAP